MRGRGGALLLLLLAVQAGAQKKFLEKVSKKTTTAKPHLLQTGDGELAHPSSWL